MGEKTYGAITLVVAYALVAAGIVYGMIQQPKYSDRYLLKERSVSSAEVRDGPQCTFIYPRGFKVAHGTKRRPLKVCTNGDLESTWRGCETRHNT